jgi:CheY-like chemotaxis protein
MLLPNWGMRVTVVDTTQEALDRLRAAASQGPPWAYSVVLADLTGMRTTALALHRNLGRHAAVFGKVRQVYLYGDDGAPEELQQNATLIPRQAPDAELREALSTTEPDRRQAPAVLRERESGSLRHLRGKVLLVEDNPVNLLVAQRLLGVLGVECDTATSGEAALLRMAARPLPAGADGLPDAGGRRLHRDPPLAPARDRGRRRFAPADHRHDRQCDGRRPPEVPGRRHGRLPCQARHPRPAGKLPAALAAGRRCARAGSGGGDGAVAAQRGRRCGDRRLCPGTVPPVTRGCRGRHRPCDAGNAHRRRRSGDRDIGARRGAGAGAGRARGRTRTGWPMPPRRPTSRCSTPRRWTSSTT